MTVRILVALQSFGEFGEEPLDLLKESGFEYRLNPYGRRLVKPEIIELAADCDGVIAGVEPYDEEVLDGLPDLKCISRCGVGIDNIAPEKAKAKGIAILNTPTVIIQPVAELTLAMALDLLRRLTEQTILIKEGRWEKKAGMLLAGKKVGVVGLGNIGKRVAELMTRLDAEVYAVDPYPDTAWARDAGVKIVGLNELLGSADIVTLHLAHSENNPFCLGEKDFSQMREGALLINLSRGRFVDENALYAALKSGRLGGAALDVFSREPYSGNLTELDNIIMTPHVATLTKESRLQMELESAANIIGFFKDESHNNR